MEYWMECRLFDLLKLLLLLIPIIKGVDYMSHF
jgi:hypothetical protein